MFTLIVLSHTSYLPYRVESPTKATVNKLLIGMTGNPAPLTPKKDEEDSMDFLDP